MRMRQFLIALAAAVLLASLATPAAGKKPTPPTPPTPFGEIGVPDFEPTGEYEDWGVRATVVVTSNVKSVLEHSLTAGEFEPPIEVEDEVRLRKTPEVGTEVRLVVGPPPYECPATYRVTYKAVLKTQDGVVLDDDFLEVPVVSKGTFTCPYEGPFPGLDYGTERSGQYWTATVVAAAWAFSPDVGVFSMTGEFTPPGSVVVGEPDRCDPLDSDSYSPWLCTWTRRFDRKAVESVTFEVTEWVKDDEPPITELPCPEVGEIVIERGGGDGFGCWPTS